MSENQQIIPAESKPDDLATQFAAARREAVSLQREVLAERRRADRAEKEVDWLIELSLRQADALRALGSHSGANSAAGRPEKYRSPAASVDPWELTEEGAVVMRQVLDPHNVTGKSNESGVPVQKAGPGVIRRHA